MRVRSTGSRSLRADLLIAAVVPLLIFTVGVAATIYTVAKQQLESRVHAKLNTVAAYLIDAAELGLLTQAAESLREPIQRALADEDVVHVSVYSARGELLITDGEVIGPMLPREDLFPTQNGPEYRALGSTLQELRQVVRYHVDRPGHEALFADGPRPIGSDGLGAPQGYLRIVMSSERVQTEYSDLLRSSAISMGVVVLLGIGLALALARSPVHGMSLLCSAAQRLGRGEIGVRVPDLGSGEISQLGRAFNEMSQQLGQAREQIAAHQAQLEQKVSERTAQLNGARVEAERANQAKSHFLANMSHEIRTPMTAILGYTDVVLEDARIAADQADLLGVIKRNGEHLLTVINGILDLSKIESGRLPIEHLPTDLVKVIGDVRGSLTRAAEEQGIELVVELRTPLPTRVLSDPARIRQGVMNLVTNALKFTERGKVTISVSYQPEHQKVRIDVTDTGAGIPPEALRSVFAQFEQADDSTTRRFTGQGLGLAITRRLARLLDGDCTAESEPGRGSTFTFAFTAPLGRDAEIRRVSREELARSERPRTHKPGGLNCRILVAEDGKDNQRLIKLILRNAGAEVVIAENGLLAVETLRADPDFDLVVMDMAMPEMDGYEATRVLRAEGCELPIVALTAHALTGEREKCIASGCDDYTTKPIDKAALIETLRQNLEKHQSQA